MSTRSRNYDAALTKARAKHVEIFTDQIHDWMSARADLKDHRVRAEYERDYQMVVRFFAENLREIGSIASLSGLSGLRVSVVVTWS